MTLALLYKLLSIAVAVALGWVAGRMQWLGAADERHDPSRTLAAIAFYIFVPALLFRTAARVDFDALPWRTLGAFFVPAVLVLAAVYVAQRRAGGAAPGVRAISCTFGNSLQIGVPVVTAVYGETGLAIHITIVSLHALVLLSLGTTLVEMDLARGRPEASIGHTLVLTVKNTVIHPVVLPVVAGLLYNAAGLPLPGVVDEALLLLSTAVVPLCLVLIGLSLATYGVGGRWRGALAIGVVKMGLMPALVLAVAHWGFGLTGLPLGVVVMMATLPTGNNALIFAQRYRTLEAETTVTIVLTTCAFPLFAALWLQVLAWL